MMQKYNIAVVGATGKVGREILQILEQRDFPINELYCLASSRSKGTKLEFKDKHIINFLKMFPIQANEMVTQALIANRPKSFWDLFNVGTNVLSHHMNRNAQSTHGVEGKLYPTIKKWAMKEANIAIA